MKGINVKKIAALAIGVALVGSAVAVADVVYGNTQLVNQNGQPTVKVVVGSAAMASDGVAAANIAAAIANNAYKSSTLTASTAGAATCTVGSTSGAGTCPVSAKQVTLEVTIPGSVAGAYQFSTLLGDYVDRTLKNRQNALTAEDMYLYAVPETSTDANPFSDGNGGSIGSYSTESIYKVGGDLYTPFATATLRDDKGAKTYKEEQAVWVDGRTIYQSTDKEIESRLSSMTYSAKFSQDNFGIPICTDGVDMTTKDYSVCDINYMTENHRMRLKFLGQDWIISGMTSTGTPIADEVTVANGGELILAKEAAYGIINVGESLDAGAVKVKLSDISVAVGAGNEHPAIIDMLDANGAVVAQFQVNPGDTHKETVGGVEYKVHVYQTSPGFTLNAKWAEMAVYSEELTLTDGEQVNEDTNPDWYVTLGWKNKGTDTGDTVADHLRTIILYNDNIDDDLKKGDKLSLLTEPAVYDLSFDGVDLTSADYDSLKARITEGKQFTIYDGTATPNKCGDDDTVTLMEITSGVSGGFYVVAVGQGEKAYFVLDGATDPDCVQGEVYLQRTTTGTYASQYAYAGDVGAADVDIVYNTAGSTGTYAAGGVVELTEQTATTDYGIELSEDAGRVGAVVNAPDYIYAQATLDAGSWTFQPTTAVVGDNKIAYVAAGPLYTSTTFEEGFVSERGTKFRSIDSTNFELQPAKKIANALYTLKTTGTASADATEVTLKEGDETTLSGGVKIKAKKIDCTIGSCTVSGTPGGAPACTVDSTAVKAVILPNNAASVEVSEPYKMPAGTKLVVLDSSAPSGTVVTVGGPVVNTVTADTLSGANAIDFNTESVVVKEVGTKIVVAGLTAEDTLTAADQFIAGIKRQ